MRFASLQSLTGLVLGLAALSSLSSTACGDGGGDADTSVTDTSDTTGDTGADDADTATPPEDVDEYVIAPAGRITVTDLGGGVQRAKIDSTADDVWVQFALTDGSQVTTESGWDLAFRRIEILSARPVAAIDADFATVTKAPADGYVEDNDVDSAFTQLGEWWEYNPEFHTVAPKVKTFIVKVSESAYFKLAVRDYYDDAGSTGLVTLDWASVEAP